MPRLNSERIRSVEFRAVDAEGGDGHTLEGYAATFNDPTRINSWEGNFDEHLAPTAFNKTLRDNPHVLMQFDHGRDTRVGSTPIGHYTEMKPDSKGLRVKGRLFDNPVVEPVRQAVQAGAVRGMSFRFTPVRDSWQDAKGADVDPDELESLLYGHRSADEDRLPLKRTLHEVKLHEAGPVVNPAYANTAVGVRSLDDMSPEDIETARAALIEEYRRTMTRSADAEEPEIPASQGPADESVDNVERSTPSDGDDDEDDTMTFDHFDTDVPVREDGLPDVPDSDYEADEESGRAAKDPLEPYGKVAYADPGYQDDKKKRYPLDTKEHAQSAWSYINVAKNAAKYTAANLEKVKAAIMAAAKKFGIQVSDGSKSESKSAPESGAARMQGTPDEYRASLLDAGFTAEEADEMLGIQRSADAAPSGTSDIPEDTRKVVSMKTKEEFEARQTEIAERLKALLGETRNQDLTDEQGTEWAALVAERKVNGEKLEQIEERRALVESLAIEGSVERGTDTGRRSAAFHADRDVYDVESVQRSAREARTAERTEEIWIDAAERAIEKAKFAPAPSGYKGAQSGDVATSLLQTIADKDGAKNLAERMLITGSPLYERAYRKFLKYKNDAFMDNDERKAWARAQELSVGDLGGFAIPFQLDPTIILTNAGTVNPIRQLAKTIQITGKQYDFVTSAGATATRGAELAVVADGSITLAQPTVVTNRVQVFIPFSYEADMAWNNIRAELTNVMVDAKNREEDSFWTGNGSGTAPQGVIGYAGTAGIPNVNTVADNAFSAADVHNAYESLEPRFEDNAVWAAHKSVYGLVRQFDTAGGAELWARIGDGQPPTLLDQKAVRVSAMQSTVGGIAHLDPAAGQIIMVVGDFSKYVIVDRVGMNVELIPQVFDQATARPTGQRGLYATWMNNSLIQVPEAFVTLTLADAS